MELTRENFRAMIYYDFRRGNVVKRWYNEFNRGRHALTNEFRKDRP